MGQVRYQLEYLQEIKDIVIAFDRDHSGKEMAQRVKTQLPKAIVKAPKANDWNIDLVNSFDWSNQKLSNEIKQQRGIERKGGLSL